MSRNDSYHKHNQSDIFCTSPNQARSQVSTTQSSGFTPGEKQHPLKKSNIVFGTDSADSHIVKRQRTKSTYDPEMYFDHSTAFERKIKEFYPNQKDWESVMKSKTNTCGTLSNEFYKSNKIEDSAEPHISAKERKIRQYFPLKTKEEIQNFMRQSDQAEQEYKNFAPNKSSKENKVDSLKSNIFHDQEKIEVYRQFKNENVKEKSPPKQDTNKSYIPHSPWKAKMDWKDPKNEILFHKDYEKANEENSSPLKRKIKDLQDHFEGNKFDIGQPELNLKDVNAEQINTERDKIKNCLKECMTECNNLKVKKIYELSSVRQGKDFYQENTKLYQKKTRPVSCFTIKNVQDYDQLKVTEIENLFKNKGYI